jgi:hypothetical protein
MNLILQDQTDIMHAIFRSISPKRVNEVVAKFRMTIPFPASIWTIYEQWGLQRLNQGSPEPRVYDVVIVHFH